MEVIVTSRSQNYRGFGWFKLCQICAFRGRVRIRPIGPANSMDRTIMSFFELIRQILRAHPEGMTPPAFPSVQRECGNIDKRRNFWIADLGDDGPAIN